MRPNIDFSKINPLSFAFFGLYFIFISMAIHEFGHAIALYMLGKHEYTIYFSLFYAYTACDFDSLSLWQIFFVGCFGGVFSSIFCYIMYKVISNYEAKIAMLSLCVIQLIYGIIEGFVAISGYL